MMRLGLKGYMITIPTPYEELGFSALEVQVRSDNRDDFEHAHRTFKSMVQKEKVIALFKEHQAYEKPSEKKRRKSRESIEKQLTLDSKLKLVESGKWDKIMEKKNKKKEERMNSSKEIYNV